MHFSLLIYFYNLSSYIFWIELLFIIGRYFTVYAACGISHAENILKLCKITYIYIITKNISENAIGSYGIVKRLTNSSYIVYDYTTSGHMDLYSIYLLYVQYIYISILHIYYF